MITEINDHQFSDVIKTGIVLVDFWAPWCGPCKMQLPILDEISKKLIDKAKFYKINVDEYTESAKSVEVRSIPLMIIFKEGQEMIRITGYNSEASLMQKIEPIL